VVLLWVDFMKRFGHEFRNKTQNGHI
jgi:hypothetical protein